MITTVTTAHAAPVIIGQRLRTGSCASPRGAARMVADTRAASCTPWVARSPTGGQRCARWKSATCCHSGSGVQVFPRSGKWLTADTAVIATGAWLSRLAGRRVRVPVQAGRGYSFTVPVDCPIPGPIYLPDVRVACTPYQGALRVSGTMEFRDPYEPAVPARVGAIVASASPLLDGVRWAERSDIWVGPRPVTPDGRPLVGEMSRGVYVAGGHGMWGLAHGPVTGRLLAEFITTGKQPEALREFDPLRRAGR